MSTHSDSDAYRLAEAFNYPFGELVTAPHRCGDCFMLWFWRDAPARQSGAIWPVSRWPPAENVGHSSRGAARAVLGFANAQRELLCDCQLP